MEGNADPTLLTIKQQEKLQSLFESTELENSAIELMVGVVYRLDKRLSVDSSSSSHTPQIGEVAVLHEI